MRRKKNSKRYSYIKKNFMTAHEFEYYKIFRTLESELNIIIQPQVSLISIIKRDTYYGIEYPKELNRIVDFAVFTRDYNVILLIEVGDNSHKNRKRVIRDYSVRNICKSANIKLLFFVPEKFSNFDTAKEFLRREIISYYDTDKESTIFERI